MTSSSGEHVPPPPPSSSPSTSSSSSAAIPPSLAPFVSPSAVGGVRFPIYAIQGVNSPLLYSPTLLGQSVLPWRPVVTTPTTAGPSNIKPSVSVAQALPLSSTSLSSHPPSISSSSSTSSSSVVTGYATSFAQLSGGLMYPLNMPLVMADPNKKGPDTVTPGNKRTNDSPSEGTEESKRPRVAMATGGPQSAGSSPSPQPPLLRPTPHRSPVIKYNLLPYNLGGATVVAGTMGQAATPTSLAQTVILSLAPGSSCNRTSSSPQSALVQATPPSSTPSSTPTPSSIPPTVPPPLQTPSLPPSLLITLLRCFGPLQHPSTIYSSQLVTSDLLTDLYRSSYHSTSEVSGNLSPESCALLTIAYLSSLRRGERLCIESLHTMLKYAKTGESEWLQYYRRHKKMSESTFVQSQLMHLSRISVYPALGRVRIMISNEHLAQGISLTLKNLTQLVAMTTEPLPDFVVVLASRGNVGVEFCVLVLEPLLSQLLLRQQRNKSRRVAHGSKRRGTGGGVVEGENPSNPRSLAEIKIDKKLLVVLRKIQRGMKGAVHIPFQEPGNGNETLSPSLAEVMTPTARHVIEHKPRGPFTEQYNVAMHLMQRISGGTTVKFEDFRTLDFCVLCPPDENLVRELRRGIMETGLEELVRGEEEEVEEGERGRGGNRLDDRIIQCCDEDFGKFSKFLNSVHGNQETLYLVIVEHADISSSLAGGVANNVATGNGTAQSCCYGEHKILLSQPNVVMLYVTSLPYRLVSNRFLVSAANEIHWPMRASSGEGGGGRGGGGGGGERRGELEFCCVGGLPGTTIKGVESGGMVVCEDERMEEEFHSLASHLCPSADFIQIRHQLLLNDYITALAGHAHSTTSHTHPETQSILRQLIEEPLHNNRGHGSMLLIRSHDYHMGQQFYYQLRAARDAVGLQYRFEMVLDTGREGLNLSPHFMRRIKAGINKDCYGNGCQSDCSHGNGCGESRGLTYRDLESVPCIVVMLGEERSHVSLPSSLCWVDLRLLYPTDITRSVYESELAWANGYLPSSSSSSTSSLLSSSSHLRQPTLSTDKEVCMIDGQEMMSESRDQIRPHPSVTPLSSSSSRRSSYADSGAMGGEEGVGGGGGGGGGGGRGGGRERGTVEWRAASSYMESRGSYVESEDDEHDVEDEEEDERERDEEDEVIDVSDLPTETPPIVTMTTTVLIDPPEDQLQTTTSTEGVWPYPAILSDQEQQQRNGMQTEPSPPPPPPPPPHTTNLFADLSDTDSDSDEEVETHLITRTCLLPRPFYHIWTSRNIQQAMLLPPATGLEWASPSSKHSRASVSGSHGNSSGSGEKAKRPPLFDPDPTYQTNYYRKWSKPGNSVAKKSLDMLLRATISGMKQRFLLTGPSQIGKTEAWQLLVRLLFDHLKSSHSVVVENPLPSPSILLQEKGSHSSDVIGTHSRVVAPGYLRQLYDELLGNDKKPFTDIKPSSQLTPPVQTTPTTPSTVISLSPHSAYDSNHSCGICCHGNVTRSHSLLLSQSLHGSHDNHMIDIKWCIPSSKRYLCKFDEASQTMISLLLPPSPTSSITSSSSTSDTSSDVFNTIPIFTPSLCDPTSALLNLTHTGVHSLHVVVTTHSKMTSYMGVWPDHVIMALPDNETAGPGMMYGGLKQFLHHNYQKNCETTPQTTPPPLPWHLIMADSCVMWRREEGEQWRSGDISLTQVLHHLYQKITDKEMAAISVPQWSTALSPSSLSSSDLNHSFLLLNVPMTTDYHYRSHLYSNFDVDFDLQLYVGGAKTIVCSEISVVKKQMDTPPLHSRVTTMATDVDKIAVSLHDSVAPQVNYPGPYLLEHYLRMKSCGLFPSSRSPVHPVLMIDHYINLGPHTHISFLPSSYLHDDTHQDHTLPSNVKFGGLILYLCEGRVSRKKLRKLNFVGGASLCLVMESSVSLVKEVGRLDLEERWKFRLRDEYKTACPDSTSFKPLYFLIGHFGL